jgi:starvation-inducible DNA-binding protein
MATTTQLQPVEDAAPYAAAAALQRVLPKLVALGLDAKHLHWNITGPAFLPLHALTDEIAHDAATWADRVAERTVALGFSVDARPETVAAAARPLPGGQVPGREAVAALIALLNETSLAAHRSLHDLDQTDPVGYDLTVELLEGLEKYRWMLRAQIPGQRRPSAGEPPAWSQLASPMPREERRAPR